jgi:hypothetical protein
VERWVGNGAAALVLEKFEGCKGWGRVSGRLVICHAIIWLIWGAGGHGVGVLECARLRARRRRRRCPNIVQRLQCQSNADAKYTTDSNVIPTFPIQV